MQKQKFVWTKSLGDNYRKKYPNFTFKQKQKITDMVLKHYFQVSDYPSFLISILNKLSQKQVRVCELGGYDGYQAYTAMKDTNKKLKWTNYDISLIAQFLTKKELRSKPYSFRLLTEPFYSGKLEECDLFYSSKTLEHLSKEEAIKCLDHTKGCRWQVHIVDWFKSDDMHVLDSDHAELSEWFGSNGYRLVDCQDFVGCRSNFFAEKKT